MVYSNLSIRDVRRLEALNFLHPHASRAYQSGRLRHSTATYWRRKNRFSLLGYNNHVYTDIVIKSADPRFNLPILCRSPEKAHLEISRISLHRLLPVSNAQDRTTDDFKKKPSLTSVANHYKHIHALQFDDHEVWKSRFLFTCD